MHVAEIFKSVVQEIDQQNEVLLQVMSGMPERNIADELGEAVHRNN